MTEEKLINNIINNARLLSGAKGLRMSFLPLGTEKIIVSCQDMNNESELHNIIEKSIYSSVYNIMSGV